jgi:hypothetical protein
MLEGGRSFLTNADRDTQHSPTSLPGVPGEIERLNTRREVVLVLSSWADFCNCHIYM